MWFNHNPYIIKALARDYFYVTNWHLRYHEDLLDDFCLSEEYEDILASNYGDVFELNTEIATKVKEFFELQPTGKRMNYIPASVSIGLIGTSFFVASLIEDELESFRYANEMYEQVYKQYPTYLMDNRLRTKETHGEIQGVLYALYSDMKIAKAVS